MEMKSWRIFIASSSKGLQYAKAAKSVIDNQLGASVCDLWDQGAFGMGDAYLETLEGVRQKYDCGLAVFTADDKLGDLLTPRDNVVLEFGLFLGAFGRERSFLLVENRADLKIPSDYKGITPGRFYPVGEDAEFKDYRNAVLEGCTSVVEQLNHLQPPGLGAALLRLEHNWLKRRPGEAFELYSFHGLRESEPADEHYNEEDVYYLWADAKVGSSIRAKVVDSDPRITEIRYENAPTGFPGNVALRPNGRNLAAQASGRFRNLLFEARIPEGETTPVTFGIRVVDALSTHWEYCRVPHEYHLMTVTPGEGWKEFVVPLAQTSQWSVFTADGNALYYDDTPDFSQVLAVVIEVGSKGAGRPGAGAGAIQLRCLRAE